MINRAWGATTRGFGKMIEGICSHGDCLFYMDGECRHGLRPEPDSCLFYRKQPQAPRRRAGRHFWWGPRDDAWRPPIIAPQAGVQQTSPSSLAAGEPRPKVSASASRPSAISISSSAK